MTIIQNVFVIFVIVFVITDEKTPSVLYRHQSSVIYHFQNITNCLKIKV